MVFKTQILIKRQISGPITTPASSFASFFLAQTIRIIRTTSPIHIYPYGVSPNPKKAKQDHQTRQ